MTDPKNHPWVAALSQCASFTPEALTALLVEKSGLQPQAKLTHEVFKRLSTFYPWTSPIAHEESQSANPRRKALGRVVYGLMVSDFLFRIEASCVLSDGVTVDLQRLDSIPTTFQDTYTRVRNSVRTVIAQSPVRGTVTAQDPGRQSIGS